MTYCGPTSQTYLMTHMSLFQDPRLKPGHHVPIEFDKTTIYGKIRSNPKFSKFLRILERSNVKERLADRGYQHTLFAAPDDALAHISEDFLSTLDIGKASEIIRSMLLVRSIDGNTITASPVSYLRTEFQKQHMYVTNLVDRSSGQLKTNLNQCATVLQFDVKASNGLIHVVDNLLFATGDHFMT